LKFNIPEGKYTAIKFGLGLDPDLNMTDPTVVAEDSPFHSSRGMYWAWATMYKFVKFEGRASADANASELTDAFLYHIGTNPFYEEITLARDIVIDNAEETKVKIVLNIDDFFNNATTPLDVINENATQTGDNPVLAQKVKGNLVSAFE
ncbi:MAG: MbnP family protein, partial [Chitinophagales bacterium]